MKNKTQKNEMKTIIPKQKKQRSVKKEKSAVTKKTAKKTRNSSMAVKLVAILVLMVAVTMVSNVINYDAMVKMTFSEHFLKFACNFYFFFLIFVTFLLFTLFYMCYNNHSVKRTSDKLSSTPNQRRDRGGNCYVDIKS